MLKRFVRRLFRAGSGSTLAGKRIPSIARVREAADARRFDEALALVDEMESRGEDAVQIASLRANVLILMGRHLEAATAYRCAIDLSPANAALWMNLGVCLVAAGDRRAASDAYAKVMELAPRLPGALLAYVSTVEVAPTPRDAITRVARIADQHADFAEAHAALGLLLMRAAMDANAALASLNRAIALGHRSGEVYATRGVALQDLGRRDEAISSLEMAFQVDPNDLPARFQLGLCRLLLGRYAEGWPLYELRLLSQDRPRRDFGLPRWQGEPLAGKRLLIYGEQGVGDEILFASCIPEVLATGVECVIDCAPKLVRLYARSFPQARVRGGSQFDSTDWAREHRFDLAIPVGSLPGLLRKTHEQFPSHRGYLRADTTAIASARARLDAVERGIWVGLSWRGGLARTRRDSRSVSLESLAPLLRLEGVRFVSLQYDARQEELERLSELAGRPVISIPEALPDYDDTATLAMACDEILSVTTALVHLCGALGRSALVLTPFSPEWRYGHQGERMIWFPSLRILRQSAYGDWTRPLALAGDALRARARAPQA